MDGTETVALIRDLAFIVLSVVLVLTAVVLGLKAMSAARSIGRIVRLLRRMRSSVASELRPAAAVTGIQTGAGLATSILRRIRGRADSD